MNELLPLRSRHAVTRLVVHMVWATRGRFPCLHPDADPWIARWVGTKCGELGVRLLAIGNGFDHVHVLVTHPPTLSVASIAHRLKGATSHILAPRLPEGFGWQDGYFAESVDDVGRVAEYVRKQRGHHDAGTSCDPEPWEECLAPTKGRNCEPT
jgi:putative transposase